MHKGGEIYCISRAIGKTGFPVHDRLLIQVRVELQ